MTTTTIIKRGQTVSFISGDVPANGKVLDVHEDAGIFVEADRPVPIVLGLGTPLEHHCIGNRLWLKVKGTVVKDRDGVTEGLAIVVDKEGHSIA